MYEIILMDLDNTVLDFDKAEMDGFQILVKEMGLDYSDELIENYRKVNNGLWRELEKGLVSRETVLNTRFQKFFQLYDMDVDGILLEERFRSFLNNSSSMVPKAEFTLTELKRRGKKIYSASNGVYDTQLARLKNAGILHLFDGHFISEQVKYEKPSPHFFQTCLDTIKTAKKSAFLMVGDSPSSDIAGANGFGIDSCFYQHLKHVTCSEATYTIRDISELLDLV